MLDLSLVDRKDDSILHQHKLMGYRLQNGHFLFIPAVLLKYLSLWDMLWETGVLMIKQICWLFINFLGSICWMNPLLKLTDQHSSPNQWSICLSNIFPGSKNPGYFWNWWHMLVIETFIWITCVWPAYIVHLDWTEKNREERWCYQRDYSVWSPKQEVLSLYCNPSNADRNWAACEGKAHYTMWLPETQEDLNSEWSSKCQQCISHGCQTLQWKQISL